VSAEGLEHSPDFSRRARVSNLAAFSGIVVSSSVEPTHTWQPCFIKLLPNELDVFLEQCRYLRITVIDEIERQLEDLAAVRLPSGGSHARREFVKNEVTGAGSRAAIGNWVYLPWEAKVVHLLDADSYFEVITNRNRDKITLEEQKRLRAKRIGVLGLSVGGEAAVTLAQEHLCGRIVLADFDRLDLSNLNRLGAGFDDLGRNKAVIVARRIVKINPYLDITVFDEGVTNENLSAFLDGLDLLIEECDGLTLKHVIRRHARERRLNVVFAADERGFLSVEPYAHWPELRPFHGRIKEPQPSRDSFPSAAAFWKALTEWLGGWDAISTRSRRSLEQIGTTLCGYPQLASEARFAAGQVGHVARRLLLGERLRPYCGHMDLDVLLAMIDDANSVLRGESSRLEPSGNVSDPG
jgi:hypothetical protein